MKAFAAFLLTLVFCVFISCGQSINSNSGDFALVPLGLGDDTPEGQRLVASYGILQNQCMSCHAEWASYQTDEAWVSSGLITRGQSDTSPLIRSLNNFIPAGGMPPSGSLRNRDYDALLEWVNFMP
jgi:hypothetical protein